MEINLYVLISVACILIALVEAIRSRLRSRRASQRISTLVSTLEFVYYQLNEIFCGLHENEDAIKKVSRSDRFYNFFDVCELATITGIGRIKSVTSIKQTKESRLTPLAEVRTIENSLMAEDIEYVQQLHDSTSKAFPPLLFLLIVNVLLEIIEGTKGEKDVRILTPSISLGSDLELDSLDYASLVVELEGLLGTKIADDVIIEELGNVFSFGDLVRFAEKKYELFKINECQ